MTDGLLSLSWNNHKTTFCHILSTLREKEKYTDVTLACEGKFYPTHKLVLSTCSEYFEKMFENTPCKHPVILLSKDVKCDELEALLSYMYDGVVSVAQNDLGRLIKVAELLQIKGLAVPDEPPQTLKSYSWSSRDDRSSPPSKRRRREDNSYTPISTDKTTSQPCSPLRSDGDLSRERRISMEGTSTDPNQKLEYKQESESVQSQENSDDATLVKEEIVETVHDAPSEDQSLDFGSQTGVNPSMGNDQGISHSQHLDPSTAQPLPEAVVEAFAGPSGMQGWLGTGDIGTGFSMLESFTEEGNPDAKPVPITATQQPHPMVWPENDNRMGGKAASHSSRVMGNSRRSREIFRCPLCQYTCAKRYNFVRHCRVHTGERPYSCPHCPYQARDNSILSQHILIHTRGKLYTCSQCNFQTKQKSSLCQHMKSHSEESFSYQRNMSQAGRAGKF